MAFTSPKFPGLVFQSLEEYEKLVGESERLKRALASPTSVKVEKEPCPNGSKTG